MSSLAQSEINSENHMRTEDRDIDKDYLESTLSDDPRILVDSPSSITAISSGSPYMLIEEFEECIMRDNNDGQKEILIQTQRVIENIELNSVVEGGDDLFITKIGGDDESKLNTDLVPYSPSCISSTMREEIVDSPSAELSKFFYKPNQIDIEQSDIIKTPSTIDLCSDINDSDWALPIGDLTDSIGNTPGSHRGTPVCNLKASYFLHSNPAKQKRPNSINNLRLMRRSARQIFKSDSPCSPKMAKKISRSSPLKIQGNGHIKDKLREQIFQMVELIQKDTFSLSNKRDKIDKVIINTCNETNIQKLDSISQAVSLTTDTLPNEGNETLVSNNSSGKITGIPADDPIVTFKKVIASSTIDNKEDNSQSLQREQWLQYSNNTFWTKKVFGIPFAKYIEAVGNIIGDDNVVYFNAEDRSRIEITVNSGMALSTIIQSGLEIEGDWFKTYRLAEKPVLLTLCGVPPFVPHSALVEALRSFGSCREDDFEFIKAPGERPSLRHVLSHRRRVWVTIKQGDTIPEEIETDFGGKMFIINIINGNVKCYGCGRFGHLRRNCRNSEVTKPQIPEPSIVKHEWGSSIIYKSPIMPKGLYSMVVQKNNALLQDKGSIQEQNIPSTSYQKQYKQLQMTPVKKVGKGVNMDTVVKTKRYLKQGNLIDTMSSKIGTDNKSKEKSKTLNNHKVRDVSKSDIYYDTKIETSQRSNVKQSKERIKWNSVNEENWMAPENEEAVFQMSSVFVDACEECAKKGDYPETILAELDVSAWSNMLQQEERYFENVGLHKGMSDFVKVANEFQKMDWAIKNNKRKRSETTSDDSLLTCKVSPIKHIKKRTISSK